jgi:hypothetical protein
MYDKAMKITTQKDADKYFELLVQWHMAKTQSSRIESEALQKSNLGYFAGYYDNETRERVERLFKCEHPVFGKIAKKGPPTPEQALQMGIELARKHEDRIEDM